jgi:hypothetical protein
MRDHIGGADDYDVPEPLAVDVLIDPVARCARGSELRGRCSGHQAMINSAAATFH